MATVMRSLAWLTLVGVVAQFYFVGLAVFGATDFELHAVTGTLLIPIALVMAIMIAVVKSTRRLAGHGFGLVVLLLLQPVLAFVPRVDAPAISALHPVVALGILFLAIRLTRQLGST